MFEDRTFHLPPTRELPRLTLDDVIAIVLVPILYSLLSFTLSLSREFLFLILFAWQTAAVGFLVAYFWASRTPRTLRFGWSGLLSICNILVGLIYSPCVFVWLYYDLGFSFIMAAFLTLLGGQAGWLLFAILKPLVEKVKWRAALSVVFVLTAAGLLWMGGRSAAGQTSRPDSSPALPPPASVSPGYIIEADLPSAVVNINDICEPDNPIQPTLVLVNFAAHSLSIELKSDAGDKNLTVPTGETGSIRIPAGEYFYTANFSTISLPAAGQVVFTPGCRTELTFWLEGE